MNETKAARYQRLRRRARAAGILSGGAALAAVALSPLGRALADWARNCGRGLPPVAQGMLAAVIVATVLVTVFEVAALPAIVFFSRRARRSTETDADADDAADSAIVSVAQNAIAVWPMAIALAIVWLLSTWMAGSRWWLVAGLGLAVVLAAAIGGAPALFGALAKTAPLQDSVLVERLSALGARARVRVARIEEWQVDAESRRTALVTGFGSGRRVLVSSELVRDWSPDEVAVVVAHELAHHRYHDLWRTLAVDAVLFSAGAGIANAVASRVLQWTGTGVSTAATTTELAALPLLALLTGAVWLVVTPLRLAQSRRQERRADVLALGLTGHAEAFSAAIRRLGARHLAEERPSTLTRWFFHRHPTMADRLELAEAYRRLKP